MSELSQPDSARLVGDVGSASQAAPPRRFVAGGENRLAVSSVDSFVDSALRDELGDAGELLVLHGPSGTGKTHLVEELVRHYTAQLPGDVVARLSGSEFAEQYAEGVEQDRIDQFRSRVRDVDLLVLEDAGRLAAKPHAQWELLYALDALQQRGACVVVTLDAPPQKYDAFLPALVGRLVEGFVCGLNAPSLESRRAILGDLAAERGLRIESKALDALALRRDATVRELRGALICLEAEALETARREAARTLFPLAAGETVGIDLPTVKRYLQGQSGGDGPALKQISEQTARHFGLRAADLKSGSRRRSVVEARDTAMYLARTLTKKSLQEIGEYFGGRDHTTVLHSCRKFEPAAELDPSRRAVLDALRERLTGV